MSETTGLVMKYFVLNPTKSGPYGFASRVALRAYAAGIQPDNQTLAYDIEEWLDTIANDLLAAGRKDE